MWKRALGIRSFSVLILIAGAAASASDVRPAGDDATAGMSYLELLALQSQAAVQAILAGQFTETGKTYRRLIRRDR